MREAIQPLIYLMIPALLIAGIIVATNAQALHFDYSTDELETWIVKPGDTLWQIASANRGNMGIREYIYNVERLNDLEGPIKPGQKLLLPPAR